MLDLFDEYSNPLLVILQILFSGGTTFMLAFRYQRGSSKHQWVPSACAFGLASLLAMHGLGLLAEVLFYGHWPMASVYITFILGFLFALSVRAKGNVERVFDLNPRR